MEHVSEPTPIASGPASSPSGLRNSHLSPLTLGLVTCGLIGGLVFTGAYLIEGATRPGYDALSQPISALSLGPGGWVQQVNFVVFGALLVLSAIGWYRALTPGQGAIWFSLLQGISGLCLIGAGCFSMDHFPGYPPGAAPATSTLHGTLHSIFAWVLIVSLALGCFTLGIVFARTPHWRGWAVYSYLTGVLILVFWALFVTNALGPLGGLYERLSAGSHDLWLVLFTATLVIRRGLGPREQRPTAEAQRE